MPLAENGTRLQNQTLFGQGFNQVCASCACLAGKMRARVRARSYSGECVQEKRYVSNSTPTSLARDTYPIEVQYSTLGSVILNQ